MSKDGWDTAILIWMKNSHLNRTALYITTPLGAALFYKCFEYALIMCSARSRDTHAIATHINVQNWKCNIRCNLLNTKIFVWAVLHNKHSLSVVFWSFIKIIKFRPRTSQCFAASVSSLCTSYFEARIIALSLIFSGYKQWEKKFLIWDKYWFQFATHGIFLKHWIEHA